MDWRAKGTALSLGVAVAVATVSSAAGVPEPDPAAPREVGTEPAAPGDDPRVRAFVEAYAPLIDSVTYGASDVVFHLGDTPIHFRGGRMLAAGRGSEADEACDPIFYAYPLGPLTDPVSADEDMPVYCTDVLESLWGRTESEIRGHASSVRFLDHRMFVNDVLVEPLARAEQEIRAAAGRDASVAEWTRKLDITYSFADRSIAGSPTRSHHGWGLAVDFVPTSYGGLHVYWRWSRVYDRAGWDRIPLEQRWSPPLAVIEIFERNGFVWGGKWAHFDVIHFEYRPEIILYNRMLASAEQ